MRHVSVADAMGLPGLRLVLTPGVPGPWSVAAKAVFDFKRIEFTPVAQVVGARDRLLRQWTGQESAPAAMLDEERPRTRWDEILLLAERLAPEPRLIPTNEDERAELFGLSHTICGEDGLGWNCRVFVIAAPADPPPPPDPSEKPFLSVDQLAVMRARYCDSTAATDHAFARMTSILGLLARRLRAAQARGSRYLVGASVSAADLYWAAFSNLISPIAAEACPMPDGYRAVATGVGATLGDALDPILVEHRDRILRDHFRLPMGF